MPFFVDFTLFNSIDFLFKVNIIMCKQRNGDDGMFTVFDTLYDLFIGKGEIELVTVVAVYIDFRRVIPNFSSIYLEQVVL